MKNPSFFVQRLDPKPCITSDPASDLPPVFFQNKNKKNKKTY